MGMATKCEALLKTFNDRLQTEMEKEENLKGIEVWLEGLNEKARLPDLWRSRGKEESLKDSLFHLTTDTALLWLGTLDRANTPSEFATLVQHILLLFFSKSQEPRSLDRVLILNCFNHLQTDVPRVWD